MNFPLARHIADPRRLRLVIALIFVASFLIYAVSPTGRPENDDLLHGGEIMLVSLNLDRTGTFANPYYWTPTGPTAHTAPVYVLLHAFIANTFGVGFEGSRVLWALNVGFLSLQLALLPALAVELGLSAATGVLASEARYRYPIYWSTFLPAAYALIHMFRRRWASSEASDVHEPAPELSIAN